MNASGFEHCTHRATRNNTSTRSSRLQKHAPRTFVAHDIVRDSASDHGHLKERLARLLTAFADSFGDFIRFSETNTYASLFIAYDDKSREAKATPAFDYLSHAVDMNDPLAELVVVEIFECHDESLLDVSGRQERSEE